MILADTDFGAITIFVVFEAGETSKTVDISIVNDILQEGREMFTAEINSTMSNVVIENSTALITIIDNDCKSAYQCVTVILCFMFVHQLQSQSLNKPCT